MCGYYPNQDAGRVEDAAGERTDGTKQTCGSTGSQGERGTHHPSLLYHQTIREKDIEADMEELVVQETLGATRGDRAPRRAQIPRRSSTPGAGRRQSLRQGKWKGEDSGTVWTT